MRVGSQSPPADVAGAIMDVRLCKWRRLGTDTAHRQLHSRRVSQFHARPAGTKHANRTYGFHGDSAPFARPGNRAHARLQGIVPSISTWPPSGITRGNPSCVVTVPPCLSRWTAREPRDWRDALGDPTTPHTPLAIAGWPRGLDQSTIKLAGRTERRGERREERAPQLSPAKANRSASASGLDPESPPSASCARAQGQGR